MESNNFCLVGDLEGVSAPFYIKNPYQGFVGQGDDTLMVIVVVRAYDKLYRFYLLEESIDVRKCFFELYAKLLASRVGDRVSINANPKATDWFGRQIISFNNMSRFAHNHFY